MPFTTIKLYSGFENLISDNRFDHSLDRCSRDVELLESNREECDRNRNTKSNAGTGETQPAIKELIVTIFRH